MTRYVYDPVTGDVVPKSDRTPRRGGLQIIKDIDGYKSRVSGKWVDGRTQQREDLKRTGCRVLEPSENPTLRSNNGH